MRKVYANSRLYIKLALMSRLIKNSVTQFREIYEIGPRIMEHELIPCESLALYNLYTNIRRRRKLDLERFLRQRRSP